MFLFSRVTVLLAVLTNLGVAQSDHIDSRLTQAPLIVATMSYPSLGLEREVLVEINKLASALDYKPDLSGRMEAIRARIAGDKRSRNSFEPVAPYTGPPIWPEKQKILYDHLSPGAQNLHRQFTFQYLVGNGQPNCALRYAEKKLDKASQDKIDKEAGRLRQRLLGQIPKDRVLVAAQVLEPVISMDELLPLIGELYEFKSETLKHPIQIPPSAPDLTCCTLLHSPHIKKELKFKLSQAASAHQLLDSIRKESFLDVDAIEEGDPEVFLEEADLDPKEKERIEASALERCEAILDEIQQKRFRQILVQRYLGSGKFAESMKLLGLDLPKKGAALEAMRKSQSMFGVECLAAQQLRGWEIFSPLTEKYLDQAEWLALIRTEFIPNDPFGVKPTLNAPIFDELRRVKKKDSHNPRRENR